MSDANSKSSVDNRQRALWVALLVAFVCSLFVSTAAVFLRPLYVQNIEAHRAQQLNTVLTSVAHGLDGDASKNVTTHMVDLSTGQYDGSVNADTFDARVASNDPQRSVPITPAQDLARISRRPQLAKVFVGRDEDNTVEFIILPVWGGGYQSTLYGYLTLAGDANTVLSLTFHEHGETPGLGARIDEPDWVQSWAGKRAFDSDGTVILGVAKGRVSPGSERAQYLVDGLSGATRTSDGVTNLLRYWLSKAAYGPYLDRVRDGSA